MEFREIAHELGISTRWVQQLYVAAIRKLKKADPEILDTLQYLTREREKLRA